MPTLKENQENSVCLNMDLVEKRSVLVGVIYFVSFTRPLATMSNYINVHIGGFGILEIFSIVTSLLLIFAIISNLKNIELNLLSIHIIFFCTYCMMSMIWGSSIRHVARMILPFVMFFAVKALIINERQSKKLLMWLILGHGIMIIVNTLAVGILGIGNTFAVYQSGLTRFGGVTGGVHTLAHSMFLYSVIYLFYHGQFQDKHPIVNKLSVLLLCMSFYCIFKTYTRTVYIGTFSLWLIYIFATNKKIFMMLIILFSIVLLIFHAHLELVFRDVTKAVREDKLEKAGSGRGTIWRDAINEYAGFSFEKKILGIGLGFKKKSLFKEKSFFVAKTHNDYIGVLITTGIIGLVLYLSILVSCYLSAFMNPTTFKMKAIVLSLLISVTLMNFGSNSYISRVELAQLFWLFIGLFFAHSSFERASQTFKHPPHDKIAI